MTLSKDEGLALWHQISQAIADEIAAGGFSPGDRLPTEAELASTYAVNRHTVRRAMHALQERGLVRSLQGRGTFVEESAIDYRIAKRTRFSESVGAEPTAIRSELLSHHEEASSKVVARALKIRKGTRVIVLRNRRWVDDRPMAVADHYFLAAKFSSLASHYHEHGSITRALMALGVKDYTRATTRVTTRMPQPRECEELKIARMRPVLVSEAVNIDVSGQALEYGVAVFAGDRVQLVFEA